MNIGIIGAGNMGGALGKIWAQQGHHVIFSFSKDESKLAALAAEAGERAKSGTVAEAAQESEVIFLSTPAAVVEEALQAAGSLEGKIIITCVSGLRPDTEGKTMGLPTELKISMAERIAELAPGARVVEAFNTTMAETLQSPSRLFHDERPDLFYCGDDGAAKTVAEGLILECGYKAIDIGGLEKARVLETLATVWFQFTFVTGLYPNVGLKALRR